MALVKCNPFIITVVPFVAVVGEYALIMGVAAKVDILSVVEFTPITFVAVMV